MQSAMWLRDRPSTPSATKRLSTAELLSRRRELRTLMESAPLPLGPLLADLVSSGSAAAADPRGPTFGVDRNSWILTNWPHVVELREIESIIASLVPGPPGTIDRSRTDGVRLIAERQLDLGFDLDG